MALEFGNQSKSYLSKLVRHSDNGFKAFAYENLSISSAAVFTPTIPAGTKYMEIRTESTVTASVPLRYLITGGIPTAVNGMALNHLDMLDFTDYQNIQNFKVIRTAAGTHNLHIQYYK